MDLGLKNKVAFIAASSDGLGKAVAMELANEGATIIINGRNKTKLENTRNDIEQAYNTKVLAISGDLANSEEREGVIKTIFSHYSTIDILVTNTGGPPSGKFEDLSMDDWNNTYKLLLASTVSLIKAILPGMKDQHWGRIIAITSQAVKQPVDNLILSNSVRASVAGLMKTLASELGEHNITVNNVMPGYTKTNRLLSLIESNPSFKSAIDEIPLKRFGNPEEFAAAVTFLASERASYITGTSLAVDGGWIKHIL
ncbi:SDR family oxidoreductase [Flavobacteriaceae bacterium S0825]|uniref:SDR family oxidoreductase n=1 Tax=Gaetbulibacter sp. S0825 TaxID=2720084 RepID=UPI00143138B0|nr:SDR family oxidoreductase [Gaetbulibacter sp. S0825]MCK0109773.1 SDR family oxidoreductase [Flavobacteriaceae bacterium S0825]NIX65405.1 SDR family oxidoreductase [Gaetbulibacter sp. S0825]